MTRVRKLKINVSENIGKVSGLLRLPENATALMVLAHGAGAGMNHAFMETLSIRLSDQDVGTLRFNFAYMEKGSGPPDRPKKAHPVIAAAIKKSLKYTEGLTLIAGGKSFGGRMISQMAANGELANIQGIIYYGYPLHAPGKPGIERAAHLSSINIPQLFLQGTRDALATIDLIEEVCAQIEDSQLIKIEGGNHSFKTLKKMGITHEETIEQLAVETAKFAKRIDEEHL